LTGPTIVPRSGYSSGKTRDEHRAFSYCDKGWLIAIDLYPNACGAGTDIRGYCSVMARFISPHCRARP
jgi:hypothetical protein